MYRGVLGRKNVDRIGSQTVYTDRAILSADYEFVSIWGKTERLSAARGLYGDLLDQLRAPDVPNLAA